MVTRNLNKIIDVNFYPVPEVRVRVRVRRGKEGGEKEWE